MSHTKVRATLNGPEFVVAEGEKPLKLYKKVHWQRVKIQDAVSLKKIKLVKRKRGPGAVRINKLRAVEMRSRARELAKSGQGRITSSPESAAMAVIPEVT